MTSHQRRDHSTNQPPSGDANESQAALIQESKESMARRASQADSDTSSSSVVDAKPRLDAIDEVCDEETDIPITTENDTIYIKDEPELYDPSPAQFDQSMEDKPKSSNVKMAIGYVLQANHINQAMSNTADDEVEDDYPEAFALDEWELPPKPYTHTADTTTQSSSSTLNKTIIHSILILLNLEKWLSPYEILDLWTTFLTPPQRTMILSQLHAIDIAHNDTAILSALHGSVLIEVMHAWAQFKLLTFQLPPNLRQLQYNNSARATTYSILNYCTTYESLIKYKISTYRMPTLPPPNTTFELQFPDLLRILPDDQESITPDAPFVDLLEAMERRVRCRLVHPEWMAFTNELVLKEMGMYIRDLKIMAEALGE